MQIQEGMEFDCTLAFSELRPGEKSQTQIDGCRIQDIYRLFQFDTERVRGVKCSGFRNQYLSEFGINTPIPVLIGIGQSVAGDLPSDPQMIKPGLRCPETGLDISQTFSVGELGKCHAEILVEAGKLFDLEVAIVAIDTLMKHVERKMLHYLRKNDLAGVLGSTLRTLLCEDGWTSGKISSRLMA